MYSQLLTYLLGSFICGFITSYWLQPFITKQPTKDGYICSSQDDQASLSKRMQQELHKIYNDHEKKKHETTLRFLKENVPQDIIKRIPEKLYSDFQSAIEQPPRDYGFAAYYAIQFLEKYNLNDEIVINWLANKYHIELT